MRVEVGGTSDFQPPTLDYSFSRITQFGKELNFGKAKFCEKSGAYVVYVSIFKQNFNTAKIVIILQTFPLNNLLHVCTLHLYYNDEHHLPKYLWRIPFLDKVGQKQILHIYQ